MLEYQLYSFNPQSLKMKMKTVVLTKARKILICSYKEKYGKSIPLGSEEWIRDLYYFLVQHDKQIKHKDVVRWVKNHTWISVPLLLGAPATMGVKNRYYSQEETVSPSNSEVTTSWTSRNNSQTQCTKRQRVLDYYEEGPSTSQTSFRPFSDRPVQSPNQLPEPASASNTQVYHDFSDGNTGTATTVAAPNTKQNSVADHRRVQAQGGQNHAEIPAGCARSFHDLNKEFCTEPTLANSPPRYTGIPFLQMRSPPKCFSNPNASPSIGVPLLEQIPYTSQNVNESHIQTNDEFNYQDPRTLHKFNQAFASIRYLSYICNQNDQLRAGLVYVNPLARLLNRIHLDVTAPIPYTEAHKEKLIRMKVEAMENHAGGGDDERATGMLESDYEDEFCSPAGSQGQETNSADNDQNLPYFASPIRID